MIQSGMTKPRTRVPRAQRGETLAEVLVALLIIALSSMLLATMVTVSAQINITARQKDDTFYAALSEVEALNEETAEKEADGTSLATFKVLIEPTEPTESPDQVSVNVYTQENLTIYKKAVGP